ncbi:HHE domain-containing protein [Gymnopilus junonius]|uniref:HHE domain-containing protein n=1 Tax=Gymnopilus junonius TaxID=109634 RepID=A0A9P5NNA6_GYMJU|nr:HHE domain-containing protein [Gymnopilus junonius]
MYSLSKKASREMATIVPIRTTQHVGGPLIDAVADDHQEMYDYYAQYEKNAGNADLQERWSNQFRWEVARHAVGEELVIYPLMEKHLGARGKELADKDRSDHHQVKELLYKLESLTVGTNEHASVLKSVVELLKPHNDSEEQNDLPLLQDAIANKKFAPTRSHPSAPDKPPFETLAGLMAAPLDMLKDSFAKFPTEEEKKAVVKD